MHSQGSTNMAIPQGDGDARPFLAHIEKRGPAFDGLLPVSTAEQLGASLMAQAVTVCGEVLQAIHRDRAETAGPNPMEVIGAWSRMLRVLRVAIPRAQQLRAVPTYGTADRWKVVRVLTHAAFANMQSLDANRHWLNADSYLRHFMRLLADAKLKEAEGLKLLTREDELEDGPVEHAYLAQLADDADQLLAFAEGRS